jgi:hypothetical protein
MSARRSITKKSSSRVSKTKKSISKKVKKTRRIKKTKKSISKSSKKVKQNKKTSPVVEKNWKKVTLTIGYKPHRKSFTDNHLSDHLKKYAGKVVLWDFFGKLRSCDFDKIKVKNDKVSFLLSLDALKEEYGAISDSLIKKCINQFDPEKSTINDNVTSFWKILTMGGNDRFHLFVKKVSISKNK